MVKTLTKFAEFSRLIEKGKDKIMFVMSYTHNFNVAELRGKSNAIHKENISKNCWTVSARRAQTEHLERHGLT